MPQEFNDIEEINCWLEEYQNANDKKLKNQLKNLVVLAYLPLVKKISHGVARRNTDPVDDIIQVGSVGLLKAIDFYKPGMGASFKTYATHMITGEIRHYIRDKVTMIRAPREIQELAFRINQMVQKLTAKTGEIPTDFIIAEHLEIPIAKVSEVIDIDRRKKIISLDQVITGNNDGEQSLSDKLVDDKYQDYLRNQEDRIMILDAVKLLGKQHQEVINLIFFEDRNQMETAAILGISQMQVSRRLKKALIELFEIIVSKNALID